MDILLGLHELKLLKLPFLYILHLHITENNLCSGAVPSD